MDLKRFADLFLGYRRLIVLALVAFSLLAAFGLSQVGFDDSPRDVFRSDDADFRLMEEVFNQFGPDENTCYLLVTAKDLFQPAALNELRSLVDRVEQTPGISEVVSLLDRRFVVLTPFPRPLIAGWQNANSEQLQQMREEAQSHPLVGNQLLSPDGHSTLVTVEIEGAEIRVNELQPIVTRLWELAGEAEQSDLLSVQVTGVPAIRVDAFDSVRTESVRYTLLGAIASITMAILLMRKLSTIIVVCAAALTGAFWSVGAVGLIGEEITVLSTVLPMLAMIVGFTDSVHLASDISHSRASGLDPRGATHLALRHLTIACLLTSITTAVGFASLCVTETAIIRRFGVTCSIGALLTFAAVITVLPLLSSSKLGLGMLPARRAGRLEQAFQTFAGTLIEFTLRNRRAITVAGLFLTVSLVPFVIRLRPENEIAENLPADNRSIQSLQTVDEIFGGILPLYICVDWPEEITLDSPRLMDAIKEIHEVCDTTTEISAPLSLLSLQQAAGGLTPSLFPESVIDRIADPTARRTVVLARVPDLGTGTLDRIFQQTLVRLQQMESRYPGFRFRLTGSAVLAARNLGRMITDLASSLSLATAVIFLTITLSCRSLKLGLICLIPNALPLLLTAALLAVFDGSLRFAGVIVFSVCLGIAVDDTIHLVMRFRREVKATGSVEEAIRRSVRGVGGALMITTLVLLVGLSIPLTSDVPGNRMFAGLSCIAIASALIADLLLLPAMLAWFVRDEISV